MTNIAAKNASLIVKDGKVAENCNCCKTANCQPGSPYAPGPSAASITVSLSNIRPTASGLSQIRPSGKWLEFLGNNVSTDVYLNFNAYNNSLYDIKPYETIQTNTYLGNPIRMYPPSAFAIDAARCFFRYGDTRITGGYTEARDTNSNSGWYVPAMMATWQLQDGVYVYVNGAVTGVVNFVPPGSPTSTPLPRIIWRDQNGSLTTMTAGGFLFEAGFSLSSFTGSRTLSSQTASNLFSSTSPGTTYTWSYDITVSMQ